MLQRLFQRFNWNIVMRALNTRFTYGPVSRAFHWLTAILILAAYILSRGGPEQRVYAASSDFIRQTHETLGIIVFALVLLRLLWRLADPSPEDLPMAAWMKISAKIVHAALYVLLLAIPLTAISGAWLEGHPITLFGIGDLGPALPQAHALGAWLAELHTWLGNAILWVAGLHTAAALYHHFVLGDAVLIGMLPSMRRIKTPLPGS
jgi:cytochrome b561